MMGGVPGGSFFSPAHGATDIGAIFFPRRSKTIGPRCPPARVTYASTRFDASFHDGSPSNRLRAGLAERLELVLPMGADSTARCDRLARHARIVHRTDAAAGNEPG